MNGKIAFEFARRGKYGMTPLSHASLLLNKCWKVVLGVRGNYFSEFLPVHLPQFAYIRPKVAFLLLLKNDMKSSEPEWAKEEQITSQVTSPTHVGHILWQVYLEMFCEGYTSVHILKVKNKCWIYCVTGVPRNVLCGTYSVTWIHILQRVSTYCGRCT